MVVLVDRTPVAQDDRQPVMAILEAWQKVHLGLRRSTLRVCCQKRCNFEKNRRQSELGQSRISPDSIISTLRLKLPVDLAFLAVFRPRDHLIEAAQLQMHGYFIVDRFWNTSRDVVERHHERATRIHKPVW